MPGSSPHESENSNQSNPVTGPDVRRHRTFVRDTFTQHFEDSNLEFGSTELEDKIPAGSNGKSLEVVTNCWGIRVPNQFPVYQYDVTIEAFLPEKNRKSKSVFLTKKTETAPVLIENKKACRLAFQRALDVYEYFFQNKYSLYYDLQSLLFTTRRLELPADPNQYPRYVEKKGLICPLRRDQFDDIVELTDFVEIGVLIKPVEREQEIIAGDKAQAFNKDTSTNDRMPCNYLEIGISQIPYFNTEEFITFPNGRFYLIHPENYVDRHLVSRCNNLSRNKYIAPGFKKGIRFVKGQKELPDSANYGMFLYPYKTGFFRSITVKKFLENNGYNPSRQMNMKSSEITLKGLIVHNKLNPIAKFKILGMDRPPGQVMTTIKGPNGNTLTVEEYIYNRYEYALQYPYYPCVYGKSNKHKSVLPVELAVIEDNQVIQKNQYQQREDAEAIKISAQKPYDLREEIIRLTDSLKINENPYFKEVGITRTNQPLELEARVLTPPKILYESLKPTLPKQSDTRWTKRDNYLYKGKIGKFGVVLVSIQKSHIDEAEPYWRRLVNEIKIQGIEIPNTPTFKMHLTDQFTIEDAFKHAKDEDVEFLFFISDENLKRIQGIMKQLEREYQIGTQNVKTRVADDVGTKGLKATIDNIIHKTNMKAGGLNFDIDLLSSASIKNGFGSRPLIIGVSLCHLNSVDTIQKARGGAVKETTLSGFGFCANTGKRGLIDFVGDHCPSFAYRNEDYDAVSVIVQKSAINFKIAHGNLPTSIVLYLNGTSEGDFQMILKFEIPLIQRALKSVFNDSIPPMTVIVPHKQHMAKIFRKKMDPGDSLVEQNLPPGTVVDRRLVHPTINEFYMQSHMALQGTAKSPRYIILKNTNVNADMDAITELTNQLCYAYQITNCACSLPAPCMIAGDYAERGAKIYKNIKISDVQSVYDQYGYLNSEKFKNHRINA